MKKALYLILFAILFTSCEKEILLTEKKSEIIISVNYTPSFSSSVYKDVSSKIYMYYGITKTDVLNYKLNESENGVLYHEKDVTKIITPDSVGTVDINGIFSVIPDKEINKILFQVESNYYKDKGLKMFLSEDLSYYQEKYRHTITFNY